MAKGGWEEVRTNALAASGDRHDGILLTPTAPDFEEVNRSFDTDVRGVSARRSSDGQVIPDGLATGGRPLRKPSGGSPRRPPFGLSDARSPTSSQ